MNDEVGIQGNAPADSFGDVDQRPARQPDADSVTPPLRSAAGTTWRTGVVVLVSPPLLLVGAWLTAWVYGQTEQHVALAPSFVGGLIVGGMATSWLRAKARHAITLLVTGLAVGLLGAAEMHRGRLEATRFEAGQLTLAAGDMLFLAALAINVLAVVWAGVAGHRDPQVPSSGPGHDSDESL